MHGLRKTIGGLVLASAATLGLALAGAETASATAGAHSSLTCSRYINNAGSPTISCTAVSNGGFLHYLKGVDTANHGLTFFASASCRPPQDGLYLQATSGTGDVSPSDKFKVNVALCGSPAAVDVYTVDQSGNVTFLH